MRVGSVNNCLRPFREQNSLYRLIPLGVCFWLLIKFIFRSPRIYTSWASKLSVSDIAIEIADILGKNRLHRLGFNIPVGKLMAWQAVMLNKAAEELPSESDITKVDDIELQKIAEKASGIISQIKDIQTDTEDLFEHPLREFVRFR